MVIDSCHEIKIGQEKAHTGPSIKMWQTCSRKGITGGEKEEPKRTIQKLNLEYLIALIIFSENEIYQLLLLNVWCLGIVIGEKFDQHFIVVSHWGHPQITEVCEKFISHENSSSGWIPIYNIWLSCVIRDSSRFLHIRYVHMPLTSTRLTSEFGSSQGTKKLGVLMIC